MKNFSDIVRFKKTIKIIKEENLMSVVVNVYGDLIKESKNELTFAILLDKNNFLFEIIYDLEGSEHSASIHYKDILLRANKIGANKIFILHSHPNHTIMPSDEDRSFLNFITSYFSEWNLEVVDSLIISNDITKYYSMVHKEINAIEAIDSSEIKSLSIYNIINESSFFKGYFVKNLMPKLLVSELNLPLKINRKNFIEI
jgi:proteasome lid subunit RPN8/RPN11